MKKLAAAALFGLSSTLTVAALTPAFADGFYTKRFSDVAVGGYDTVALLGGDLVEGTSDFESEYQGATFRFSTAANRDAFAADPDKYAPQYGGYCAWAAAEGKIAPGDARYATVYEGKLYLNFNQDVSETFQTDVAGFVAKADANWPSLKQDI